jgi:hypothetical protein
MLQMKIRWAFFAILAGCFFLAMDPMTRAVNTAAIDRVRAKGVLDAQDYKVIDEFLAEAIQELVRTRDLATIAKRRTVILSRKGTQGQYAQQFSEAAHKYIQAGLQEAQTLSGERKTSVTVNLLILVDGLEDPRLNDLALEMLKSDNMVVRYWAVSCLTNPAILVQLKGNTDPNPGDTRMIADRLMEIVPTSDAEVLFRMTRFIATVNSPQSEALLLRIADERMKRYVNWTVRHELYDIAILQLLANKIPVPSSQVGGLASSSASRKPEVARRFAQLYSYAIERYVKGKNAGVLREAQIGYLISVLVDVDEKSVSRLLGQPQTAMRRAIERDSTQAVMEEHDRLLGSATTPGELPTKLGFDYGTAPDGAKLTFPIPLPDPPAKPKTEG